MKRLLPSIPIIFLILLDACGQINVPISDGVGTAVTRTQTAAVWTLAPTYTPNPNSHKIVDWLNAELSNVDPLEQSLDARYRVTNVSFLPMEESPSLRFLMKVRCECSNSAKCCIPERTFVVIATIMKKNANRVMEQVPVGVREMKVVCADHEVPVGAMSAVWSDVINYLYDNMSGYQLGPRVIRASVP